jgi:hypothetical protein
MRPVAQEGTGQSDQGGQEGVKNGRIPGVGWMPGEIGGAVSLTGDKRLPQGDIDAAVMLYLKIAIQSAQGEDGEEGHCQQRACLYEGHCLSDVEPTTGVIFPASRWP